MRPALVPCSLTIPANRISAGVTASPSSSPASRQAQAWAIRPCPCPVSRQPGSRVPGLAPSPFQQQHLARPVEGIEQGGDFIGQRHARRVARRPRGSPAGENAVRFLEGFLRANVVPNARNRPGVHRGARVKPLDQTSGLVGLLPSATYCLIRGSEERG